MLGSKRLKLASDEFSTLLGFVDKLVAECVERFTELLLDSVLLLLLLLLMMLFTPPNRLELVAMAVVVLLVLLFGVVVLANDVDNPNRSAEL